MDFMLEQCIYQAGKDASDAYWTFWVRVYDPTTGDGMTTGGFRYWPGKNSLAEPSRLKDTQTGRWSNTTKLTTGLYQRIKDEAMYKFNRAEYDRLKGTPGVAA